MSHTIYFNNFQGDLISSSAAADAFLPRCPWCFDDRILTKLALELAQDESRTKGRVKTIVILLKLEN